MHNKNEVRKQVLQDAKVDALLSTDDPCNAPNEAGEMFSSPLVETTDNSMTIVRRGKKTNSTITDRIKTYMRKRTAGPQNTTPYTSLHLRRQKK
jgi:hypothetical protein